MAIMPNEIKPIVKFFLLFAINPPKIPFETKAVFIIFAKAKDIFLIITQ